MAKKQTKADKDFIAKIATLGIKVSSNKGGHPPTATCPGCGTEGKLIGTMNVPIYAASGHSIPELSNPQHRERAPRKQEVEGDGFAA